MSMARHTPAPPVVPGAHFALPSERDACGIGFVARTDGRASRDVVRLALDGLGGVQHRGAVAADGASGDGAGILTQLPQGLVRDWARERGADVADDDALGLAFLFLDGRAGAEGDAARVAAREAFADACRTEQVQLLAWRDVPFTADAIGPEARDRMPGLAQAIMRRPAGLTDRDAERLTYRLRRRAVRAAAASGAELYAASCSFATVVYKAMADAAQLGAFYPDLDDPRFVSALAVFHSRFSTNTMPTWQRAQPFRMLCHNGEINTIEGNANLMQAREGQLVEGALSIDGEDWCDPALLSPVIDVDQSDSAKLDAALELLVNGGRDLRHAQAMLVPQAWQNSHAIPPDIRDFYRYHDCLVEPWDGPAALIFTDGVRVGAALDRNGLRPLRYHARSDGLVIAASEVGAIRVELPEGGPAVTVRRGRLGPGQMLCVDPDEGGLLDDRTIKHALAARAPYGEWIKDGLIEASTGRAIEHVGDALVRRQLAFGFTKEEITSVLRPMATQGKEAVSSMGDDTPIEALSLVHRPVSHLLKQRFAQVTNPPIDHLREREVMSIRTRLGRRAPILTEGPESVRLVELDSFLMTPDGLRQLAMDTRLPWPVMAVDATFAVSEGEAGLERGLERLSQEALEHVRAGAGILVVSDVSADLERARIPILLAVGSVHQRLVAEGVRTRASIVAETDEARTTHDAATLLGYGADAIVPRLVLETIAHLADEDRIGGDNPTASEAQRRYRSALEDGVRKVMSKMGISVLDSYRSAQIFEALGLAQEVVDRCFTGTVSVLGGHGFADLARTVLEQHAVAYAGDLDADSDAALPSPGIIKWRKGGEFHDMSKPVIDSLHDALGLGRSPATEPFVLDGAGKEDVDGPTAALVRQAAQQGRTDLYRIFSETVRSRPPAFPRDLLTFDTSRTAVPLAEVEPVAEIVRRFSTGAMSHGALSKEAHETLAAAMNMIGGRANSGEGGESPHRFRTRGSGLDLDCRIKQVASGRFGVTPEYLANAEVLQIKMAQGSKPGEGGQIPGHKVTDEIARLRHTTPGVTLISPPPHHDIYSIEDLAQLIFDLKQVNPAALVDVKLVSLSGIGTVAAGVVKALADSIHISGNDGGTGASPLSSIQHAGMPWELGLVEVQRTLRRSGLRGRVRLRVDGGFKTGHDVMLAALLGADEYAFGTAALFAEGCIMARACHRDTCPVGVATQRLDLREKFAGTPDTVAAYLVMVAEEVRELLAAAGFRTLDEAIGRVDALAARPGLLGVAARLDVSGLLADPGGDVRHFVAREPIQDPRSELGDRVAEDALETVFLGGISEFAYPIAPSDRTVGARLGGAVGLEFGEQDPPGLARLRFTGAAGQSFGAFVTRGVELVLEGEANDYVGKGLGGGRIVIRPPADDAGEPVLLGNTALYGATAGELFVAGRAGERFAVRNSGATAVVEGVGDHACEYMTGGTVVVLGPTGANIGAGMSGGRCFVLDTDGEMLARINRQLVEADRPGQSELLEVSELLREHVAVTGSTVGQALLDDWAGTCRLLWRIAPASEGERAVVAGSSSTTNG